MALPSVPSQLRGIAQARSPVFDPRTGTYVYPGFNGGGLSTTGNPPVTPTTPTAPTTPTTTSPPPPPTTPTNPLFPNGTGGGTQSGLRGITAERTRTGGDGRRGNPGPNGRVDLNGPMGDVLDAIGTVGPGPIGAVATATKGLMGLNNAMISRDQLRDVGYTPGLTDAQLAGAALHQVSPFGVAGNNYGDGDWRSVMDASVQAQRGYYAGDQQFQDPTGMKTSPAGPVGTPNPQTVAAAQASAAPPAQAPAPPTSAPPSSAPPSSAPPTAGIRGIQAGGRKTVRDMFGRDVTDRDIQDAGQLAGTKATGRRPTPPDRQRGGGEGRSNRGEPRDHDPGEGRSSATGRGYSDGSPGMGGESQGGI